jgi:predicted RNA-binding protein Jag
MNYYSIINVDYYSIKKVGLCTYKIVINLSIENESKEFTGYISDPDYISELESINDTKEQNDCYFQAIENQIENEVNEWLTHIY